VHTHAHTHKYICTYIYTLTRKRVTARTTTHAQLYNYDCDFIILMSRPCSIQGLFWCMVGGRRCLRLRHRGPIRPASDTGSSPAPHCHPELRPDAHYDWDKCARIMHACTLHIHIHAQIVCGHGAAPQPDSLHAISQTQATPLQTNTIPSLQQTWRRKSGVQSGSGDSKVRPSGWSGPTAMCSLHLKQDATPLTLLKTTSSCSTRVHKMMTLRRLPRGVAEERWHSSGWTTQASFRRG